MQPPGCLLALTLFHGQFAAQFRATSTKSRRCKEGVRGNSPQRSQAPPCRLPSAALGWQSSAVILRHRRANEAAPPPPGQRCPLALRHTLPPLPVGARSRSCARLPAGRTRPPCTCSATWRLRRPPWPACPCCAGGRGSRPCCGAAQPPRHSCAPPPPSPLTGRASWWWAAPRAPLAACRRGRGDGGQAVRGWGRQLGGAAPLLQLLSPLTSIHSPPCQPSFRRILSHRSCSLLPAADLCRRGDRMVQRVDSGG